MKTLYVTDLDGTLLQPDETLSPFTIRTINALVDRGLRFSFATARSIITSMRVTEGLTRNLPVILYNGAFIRRADTRALLHSCSFGEDFPALLDDLISHGVWPIVYSLEDGQEKYRYVPAHNTPGMALFQASRAGDPRETIVSAAAELRAGQPFYLTCIDETEKLAPLYDRYREQYHCILHRDIYSGNQWLEIMPRAASKANAVLRLKELLGADRLVVFGDGRNDLDMFAAADERYAVANAVEELKAIATAVIPANTEDGVARWLLDNARL